MLSIEIYLDSAITGQRTLIVQGRIINDGTGTTHTGHYDVEFIAYPPRGLPSTTHRGRVLDFPREHGALRLLERAIAASLGPEITEPVSSASKLRRLRTQKGTVK
jgi:hypothetical protein